MLPGHTVRADKNISPEKKKCLLFYLLYHTIKKLVHINNLLDIWKVYWLRYICEYEYIFIYICLCIYMSN